MSLFDRYDQNEAELFLRDTCFTPTPQRRFEDLFEQIQQHFQYMQIFSNSDDSLKIKGMTVKNKSVRICSFSECILFFLSSQKIMKKSLNLISMIIHSKLILIAIFFLKIFLIYLFLIW